MLKRLFKIFLIMQCALIDGFSLCFVCIPFYILTGKIKGYTDLLTWIIEL